MILAYLLTLFLAYIEARYDFNRIELHLPIQHIVGWIRRAVLAGFIVWGCYAYEWLDNPWLIYPACAFLFSAFFRYRLNKLRGKPPTYISESNYYDRVFLGLSPKHGGRLAYLAELSAVLILSLA